MEAFRFCLGDLREAENHFTNFLVKYVQNKGLTLRTRYVDKNEGKKVGKRNI